MEENIDSPLVTMTIVHGCLVVPIQVELYDNTMLKLQNDILVQVKEKGIKGVIIDLSAVNIIDLFLAQKLKETISMVALMGAKTILTGFKPEVAASLVDMDFNFGDIYTAIDQDDAFIKLDSISPTIVEETEEDPETEDLY
jgi:rsbT antagonist protein RsbS